jgi:hypothetical protein
MKTEISVRISAHSPAHLYFVPASFSPLPVSGPDLCHRLLTADTGLVQREGLLSTAVPTDHPRSQDHLVSPLLLLMAQVTWVALTTARKPAT